MKKGLLLILLLSTITFAQTETQPANTQSAKPIAFNFGMKFLLPVGDFADYASLGIGGDITVEYPLTDIMIGTASVGLYSFSSQDIKTQDGFTYEYNRSSVPIWAGVKIFVSAKKDYYAIMQTGFQIFSIEDRKIAGSSLVKDERTDAKLGFAFGGGYILPITSGISFDGSARYIYGARGSSSIALRGGLLFSF